MDANLQTQRRYSSAEELANSLTHGIGAGLAVAGLAVLVTFSGLAGDGWRVVSFSVYGACLVLLYLASTFYHALGSARLKRLFRTFDHAAIFLLIAGTYTPISLVSLSGGWGWTLFGLIWGLAVGGIVLEVFFMDRFRWLTVATYLGMGWLVVIAAGPLVEALPFGALVWLMVGGLAYTGGVVFYLWKKLPFNHAIWHLFVLAGSACHFFGFLFYVLPTSPG
jgi:hemolysin III